MSTSRRIRVLPFVAVVLGAGAAMRALDLTAGIAVAEAAAPAEEIKDVPAAVDEPVSPAGARLSEHLATRSAELDRREAELETREILVRAAEQRLAAEVAAARSEIAALEALRTEAQERRRAEFDALSSAYERMKPRDAARIFETLDEAVLVPVATGMRTQSIAGVLAEMSPEKARRLTLLLAREEEERRGAPSGPQ